MPRRHPFCRARAAVVRDGHVLLTHHTHPDGRDFWCFPGGGVEPGESFVQAARRELREETGLEVQLLGVLFVQDFPAHAESDDCFELIFLATATGEAALGYDPERTGVLRELRWVKLANLSRYPVRPQALAERLAGRSMETLPVDAVRSAHENDP